MQPSKFLRNKIIRQLKCNGVIYVFNHKQENKFHEKIDGVDIILKGIYHEESGYSTTTGTDASITFRKTSPQILCLWENAQDLSVKDTVKIDGKLYEVSSIVNIQNYNVAANISLEEVV